MNSRGQSSIEAAVSITAVCTVVSVICVALYLIYATFWIDHILYEALICHQETGSLSRCERKATAQIRYTLFLKSAFKVSLQSKRRINSATLKMAIAPPFIGPQKFSYRKELRQ